MMVAAVGLSAGALLSSVGISVQAAQQVGSGIAASTLDLVTISVVPANENQRGRPADGESSTLPDDTDARLARVDLVESGGRRLDVSRAVAPVLARLPGGEKPAGSEDAPQPAVVAVSAGYLRAARAGGEVERSFLLDVDRPIAFLGPDAARSLDVPITDAPTGLQVWINDAPFDVVGFLGRGGPAALGNAVVIPYPTGLGMTGNDDDTTILVRTRPGAGAQVAEVITTAVRPDAPERLATSPVVSMDSLRRGVATQMGKLAAWIGVTLTVLTVLLIANSMVVAVLGRTREIGLRRALGSSRGLVAALFLTEGAAIGLLGGLVGAALAAVATLATAAVNGWTAVLELRWISMGPLIGTAVGLVASAYPARRAATISPALAVRSE